MKLSAAQNIAFIILILIGLHPEVPAQKNEALRFFEFGFEGLPDTTVVLAATNDPEVLTQLEAQLKLPEEERNQFVSGLVAKGTDYNNPYFDWHLVPNSWKLVDFSPRECGAGALPVHDLLRTHEDIRGQYCLKSTYLKREIDPDRVGRVVKNPRIKAYPNPTTNKLFVDLEDFQLPVQHVALYNSIGQLIELQEPAPRAGDLQFDVAGLQRGAYTLTIRTDRGRWAEKILVK